jgi:chemotaxis protein CheZ
MEGDAAMPLQEIMRDAVRTEIGAAVEELRRFIDRRIAELSTEVHGAVQMVDFSENHLSGQLQRMQEEIARVVAQPETATRNSGVELEAVVHESENAANRIMGAAETIANLTRGGVNADAIAEQLNIVFEACSFQDLTGQRIRRALQHLQDIEGMLADMADQAGAPALPRARQSPIATPLEVTGNGPDLAQDDIDRLMAGLT